MKRYVPAIVMTLLTLFAAGGGVGMNRVIRGLVALPDGSSAPAESVADAGDAGATKADARPTSRVRGKRQYIEDILARNIFDPDAIGREAEISEDFDEEGEVVTDLDLVLVGTMVAVPEIFSSAFIAESGRDAKGRGYGIGQKVLDAEIIKIEKRRVHLKRASGQVEILSMDEEEKTERSASRPTPGGTEVSEDDQIEQVSDTKFIVERELVDKYLGNLDGIARMGRAIPHRGPDGNIDGYRLSGIRRNTVGQKLGIKNGDIVHGVNGQSLTSMQGAMAAFTSLQSESGFSFDVTRRGQKMTLEYEVR